LKKINVGVVGATGVVGETFLSILEEREFPVGELRLFASENSQGMKRRFHDQEIPVQTLAEGVFNGLDLVFFSSGDDISAKWAPKAVAAGAFAVDNSAAFRMNPEVQLSVPEVNGDLLPKALAGANPIIIANPNCSTIQLVVALAPLQKKFGLKSVRVASYQSVSGAGRAGLEELFASTKVALEGESLAPSVFPKTIAFDSIPQIGSFMSGGADDGFCTEELKIMNETCKILRAPNLPVSAFTVRVPTLNSHAEAVWVTLERSPSTKEEIESCLAQGAGIELMPLYGKGQNGAALAKGPAQYPTQAMASGQDPVYVGRVHRDRNDANTWMMWVVSDNLRKGAALNGLQIAEQLFDITPRA
jgi:aspartate-semialdehyde dehydrogenase